MVPPDTPSVPQVEGEPRFVPGSTGGQHAFVEHQLLGHERQRLKAAGVIIESLAGDALPLAHSTQRHMGLERSPLWRKPDGLGAPLDTVLQQLEGWRRLDADPQDPGAASAGKCSQLTESEWLRARSFGGESQGFDNDVQSLGSNFAKELEREVQALVMHPAHGPVSASQIGQQIEDLRPSRVRNRNRGKEPHQSGEWAARASSPPRR